MRPSAISYYMFVYVSAAPLIGITHPYGLMRTRIHICKPVITICAPQNPTRDFQFVYTHTHIHFLHARSKLSSAANNFSSARNSNMGINNIANKQFQHFNNFINFRNHFYTMMMTHMWTTSASEQWHNYCVQVYSAQLRCVCVCVHQKYVIITDVCVCVQRRQRIPHHPSHSAYSSAAAAALI